MNIFFSSRWGGGADSGSSDGIGTDDLFNWDPCLCDIPPDDSFLLVAKFGIISWEESRKLFQGEVRYSVARAAHFRYLRVQHAS
jgi:hypothetical protein